VARSWRRALVRPDHPFRQLKRAEPDADARAVRVKRVVRCVDLEHLLDQRQRLIGDGLGEHGEGERRQEDLRIPDRSCLREELPGDRLCLVRPTAIEEDTALRGERHQQWLPTTVLGGGRLG
jgi:hypothetical protein